MSRERTKLAPHLFRVGRRYWPLHPAATTRMDFAAPYLIRRLVAEGRRGWREEDLFGKGVGMEGRGGISD